MSTSKNKDRIAPPAGDPLMLTIAQIAAGVAFAIAAYLAWMSLSGRTVAGCGPESGCEQVLSSRWAYLLGIPVSVPALLVYGGFIAGAGLARHRTSPDLQRRGWIATLLTGFLMIGAAAWFTIVQKAVIQKWCPFCMTAHACAFLAALMAINAAPRRGGKQNKGTPILNPHLLPKLVALAIVSLGLMIGLQAVVQPKTHQVTRMDGGKATGGTTAQGRQLSLYSGKAVLRVGEDVLMGSPTAPHVMVSLFDYTCPHCRAMHTHLHELQQRFTNQLAILSLPMPLDADCNPILRKTPPKHEHACDYARIGLAVHRANPAKAVAFDDWIFAPASPPPLEEVRAFAAQLVGQTELNKALADPWITDRLRRNVELYRLSFTEDRTGMMPQLIIGNAFVSGPINKAADLYPILATEFGIVAAP